MSGLFEKKSGGVMGKFEHRQLVLTNKPCLYYIDILGTGTTKGTIEWGKGGSKRGSKAGPRSDPKASIERDKSTGD